MYYTYDFDDRMSGTSAKRLADVVNFLSQWGLVLRPQGPWLVGGSVRDALLKEPIEGDFDVFFPDEKTADYWRTRLFHLHRTEQAIDSNSGRTFNAKVRIPDTERLEEIQLVMVPFASVEHVMNNFNVTCCQFATDGKSLWIAENAVSHAQAKQLITANADRLSRSGKHIYRYILRGYQPTKDVLDAMLRQYREQGEEMHTAPEYR